MNLFNFLLLVSDVGDIKVMVILVALSFLVSYFLNYKKNAFIILLSSILAILVSTFLKHTLKIPRPEHMLIVEDGYRFPSGHATMAAVVFALSVYFGVKHLVSSKKTNTKIFGVSIIILGLAWLLITSYARLYLGVHYLIDVVSGSVIGILSTAFIVKILNKNRR